MSTFGSGSTTTAGASITLRNFTGTDGQTAGTDGLVPGPAIAQEGYVLGAGGDWTLEVAAINNLLDSSERIATTAFVQNRVAQILAGGGITLGGIQDVNLGGLADGDFIKYNLGANEWQVHTLTIGAISDVNLVGLQAGNTIVWDAVNSEWVPGQGGGGGAANLDDLGDVNIGVVANKHFLVHNGAGQFVNRLITTTDLDDGTNIALLDAANDFTNTLTVINSDIILSTPGADRAIKVNDGVHDLVAIGNDGPFITMRHGDSNDAQYGDLAVNLDAFSFTNNLTMYDANGQVSVRLSRGTGDLTLSGDLTASDATLAGIEATSLTSTANSFPITFADAQASALVLKDANANEYMVFDTDNDQIINKVETEFGIAPAAVVRVGGGYVRFSGGGGEIAFPDLDPVALTLIDSANNNFITIDTVQNQVNHHVKSVFTNGAGDTLTVQHNALTFGGGDGEIASSSKLNVVIKDNELVADGAAFTIKDGGATNYISIFTDNADQKIVLGADLHATDLLANSLESSANSFLFKLTGGQATSLRFTDLAGNTDYLSIDTDNDLIENHVQAKFLASPILSNSSLLFRDGDSDLSATTHKLSITLKDNELVADGAAFTIKDGGATEYLTIFTDNGDQKVVANVDLYEGANRVLNASNSIDALNDVDTTTNAPQNGQALVWDGANFVPGTGGKTQEEIEDIVGDMVVGNTETGITVTYQGADNTLDFEVDNTVVGFLAGAQNFGGDKTFSGALTATGDTNLTGANFVRVPAPGADNNDATTKLYVDTGLGGKQDTNARLDDIAGLGVNANNFIVGDGQNLTLKTPTDAITSLGMGVALNDLLIGSGPNTFGTIATTAGMQTFLGTNLTIQAGAVGDVLRVKTVDGQNIPTEFENIKLASTDLSDTADLILRDGSVAFTGAVDLGGQDISNVDDIQLNTISAVGDNIVVSMTDNRVGAFEIKEGNTSYLNVITTNGGEKIEVGQVNAGIGLDLTNAVVTATTQPANLVEGNSTLVATTAFVRTVVGQGGGAANLDALADVNLGVKNAGQQDEDGVALANAQILVYDSDAGVNDNSFKNVGLSGDIRITNAGVATIQDNAITTAKINDGDVTNAKLENSYVAITDGTATDNLPLGQTLTFNAVAGETTVVVSADQGAGADGVEITIGLPDDVTIAQDLTVTRNLIVNGTMTTIDTTNLDIEDSVIRLNRRADGDIDGANGHDIGIFMERGTNDHAIFYFDEGEDIFKLGTTTSAHTATDFDATTTFGTLKLATLTTTSDSSIGGALGVTGLLNANGGIEIDNNGNKFTVSNAGAVVSVGGITDTTTASAFATDTTIGDIQISNGQIQTTANDNNLSFNDNNLSTTGNVTINANKFTVDGATGNTSVAGTLGVTQAATFSGLVTLSGGTTNTGSFNQSAGNVFFNSGLGDFDFRISGDTEANLFYVDASTDNIGIGKNNPTKTLDITGDVGVSTTLDVTGKTTLAGSLDLTTGSTTGITFRSEIANNGGDANQTLIRVNVGANGGVPGVNPIYKSVKWVAADDRFSVESGLKSEGDLVVGNNLFSVDSTTGDLSISGVVTINNAGGSSDLIVQNNGSDVLNVDVDAGTTTITGQLLTNDLRAKTADGGGDDFKIRIEDNVPNALEISDATNGLPFMVFDTTDNAELINFNQDIVVKGEVNIEHTNSNGLFFNSNREGVPSEDATLITIEGGNDKVDVVLGWDTSDNALNLNAQAQLHLQGLAGSNALTIGGALVADATIVMTTAGAITLDGTLDSPTINTNKITNKNDTSLVVELADAEASALVIRQGNNGESYLTINTNALTTTFNQAVNFDASATFDTTVEVTGITTLNDSLKVNKAGSDTGIIFNADRAVGDVPNAQDFDAVLIHVEDGGAVGATEAFVKWDDSENSFKVEGGKLFSATEISVGTEAANVLTKNFTVGTDGAVTAKTPAGASNTTDVPTTEWVRALRLGDFDQVNTAGFNANDQILVWDQDNGEFKAGTLDNLAYGKENAIDDVGKALIDGSLIAGGANGGNTGADTIQFTLDDNNDIINLALGISSGNLTDVSTDAPANLQVLRYTTEQGANQNKYVPTTLGTAADVDTGLENGEIPTLTTHYLANQNETADLILKGRVIESFDYGSITEAFDANNDYSIDMNGSGLGDSVIYGSQDYGMLVV